LTSATRRRWGNLSKGQPNFRSLISKSLAVNARRVEFPLHECEFWDGGQLEAEVLEKHELMLIGRNASTRYLFPSVLVRVRFALMTGLARMVVSGLPHHVTQRGNRREPIFFEDGDQEIYRDLLGEQARKADVEVWAYCLMPNHVHLILNPRQADGLGRAVGEAHRRYTNFINARGRWTGHLFQSRFASVAMDESHLISAVCYVSLNPVRARLVAQAEDWPWSSVRAHINGADDG
jgi:REP element-mobilizing transposase RayT